MIKNNKTKCIVSSVMILIPAVIGLLLWKHLPEQMAIHFGPTGKADGYGGRIFIVILPLIMLAVHWLCLILTAVDPKSKELNKKITDTVFFIIPVINLFVCSFMIFTAFDCPFNPMMLLPALLGVAFAVIGNIMPKAKQNHVFGIKMHTTLSSTDNWARTHRLAGKVWFFGGIAMIFAVFLPVDIMMVAVFAIAMTLAFIPAVYSLIIACKKKNNGGNTEKVKRTPWQKAVAALASVISVCAVIFAVVICFTGDVSATAEAEGIRIDSTYHSECFIAYGDIESITLDEDFDFGTRQMGFGSPRLLLGSFKNNALGSYTLYAYARQSTCIVITLKSGSVAAVSLKSAEATEELYNSLIDGGYIK